MSLHELNPGSIYNSLCMIHPRPAQACMHPYRGNEVCYCPFEVSVLAYHALVTAHPRTTDME